MSSRLRLTAVLALLATILPVAASHARTPSRPAPPQVVVALIDSGINPYNVAFRDRSALAKRHPSTYIPGYPKDAPALRLHLDLPFEKAVKADAAVWAEVEPNELYWIPGTRIIGAIRMGSGGVSCPVIGVPPATAANTSCPEHPILDEVGHGTMTASRAAGAPHSLAPDARIVEIEGLGAASTKWAASQGWIDIQSNSWLSLAPQPVDDQLIGTTSAFAYAASRTLTFAASGNGTAFSQGAAPTPTYVLSTAAPGVVLVGAHDNGRVTAWSGAPAHVVADGYGGWAAVSTSTTAIRPDPISCCTSAASPYAAGAAAAVLRHARQLLGDHTTGVHKGVIAHGRKGAVKRGPLADGELTLDELRRILFHTAEARPRQGRDDGLLHWAGEPRAPDHTEFGIGANPFCQLCTTSPVQWSSVPPSVDSYQDIGYGALNERSVALAFRVLDGKSAEPKRPSDDAHYASDQQLRGALMR
jgi:hypothetical protein